MIEEEATVSDLALERYHLGELSAAEAEPLRRRLDADPALRERLLALARSDAEIRRQHPPDTLADAVTRRLARPGAVDRATRRPGRVAALVLASASVVALMLTVPGLRPWPAAGPVPDRAADGNRVKGDAALVVYRKSGSGSELLADGTAAGPGDLVRLGYRPGGARYGVIISIDGSGVVTRHLPVEGDAAAALQAGGTTLLETAYELDAAPRWERFFLVTGEAPFSVQATLDAAGAAVAGNPDQPPGGLALPPGLHQTSFLLRKRP